MLNSDFQFVYLSYYSSLITSHFFATPVIDFSKNNGGGDDPSDPSGTHDKPKYVDYRMVDLRPYDTSGQFQIEMGVYAVTRECAKILISDYLNESDNYPSYPLTDSEGDKRPIQIKSAETAYRYCNALSEYWGLTSYYTEAYDGTPVTDSPDDDAFYGVRLPTNDEWVFAANAGLNNSLYSGPKWTGSDLDEGTFTNTGSNPVYGSHALYVDYFRLTYKELDVSSCDYTETDKNGKTVYCWNSIPETSNTITNIIDGYTPDSFGTFPQNFEMPFLSEYAWTRYNLYTNKASTLSYMPMVLMSDIYVSGDKDSHLWKDVSDDKIFRVFKIGDNYYKTNIYGWHNRVGNKEGDSQSFGTHAVGMLKPNDYGLYDMTGNVAELVKEGYYKGGSFATSQKDVINSANIPSDKAQGFRVCRNIKTI